MVASCEHLASQPVKWYTGLDRDESGYNMTGIFDKDGRQIILCSMVREYLDMPGVFDLARTDNTFTVAGFTSNGRVICSDLKARDAENLEIMEQ